MQNKFSHILKERLDNRLEWREYYEYILTHKELAKRAKKEFYKDKPLMKLTLNLYFLPLNLFRYLIKYFQKESIDGKKYSKNKI